MKNIKARTVWLIFLIEIIVCIGLLFGAIYSSDGLNKVMVVLIGIDFILITFTIQAATYKSFKNKAIKNSYVEKIFINDSDLYEMVNKNKFEDRNRYYGKSYLKIDNDNAYKVTIITDPEGYFNAKDEGNDSKLNKRLNKCKRFMGVEIFLNSNEELKEKIKDFTIQGEKVYYTALLKVDDNIYKCFNYEEPSVNHKENFDYLFDLLGFKKSE
ncbi:MAG: hypothetical protein K5892_04580 [Acholeplasmatales bacterium]|nr:hypothetical protein [Acholeplasmatales bacterium]